MTRILTRSDLAEVLDPMSCMAALTEHFRNADSWPAVGQRVRTELPFGGTAMVLVPGIIPGIDAYTVKVNAKFPAAQPALRGVIALHSTTDGELLALMDSATITAWRTGLSAALGTHALAPADPRGDAVLGVIGAGAQAELTVRGLLGLRRFGDLVVHDIDAGRAATFASRHGGRVLTSATEIAAVADIVLLATWSRKPLLSLADTRLGQHFTTLGTDEPEKRELATDLIESAVIAVDSRELAVAGGALAPTQPSTRAASVTLGALLRNEHSGRTTATARSVYAPVGLPWQDLAVAWVAYQQAQHRDIGTMIDLLA
ncbi:alanine dehydrogenase [Nocardia sp. IFM 10818]